MQGHRSVVITLAALCAAITLAACGSGNSTSKTAVASAGTGATPESSTASKSSSTSSAVQQATSQIAQLAPADPTIQLAPLGKPAPTGKTLDYVTCPVPICVETAQGAQAATKALGWKFNLINGGLTPATFTSAWDQIAQSPPSAVAGVGVLPTSAIATQLKTLIAQKIPYVSVTSPSPVGDGLDAIISGPPEVARSGTLLANWVVSDAKGANVDTVYVYDPSSVSIVAAYPAYTRRLHQLCPGCGEDVLKVSLADIGTKIPGEVVSYVQSHPSLKYVVMGLGDLAAGVPEALKAAGLSSQVKIVTRVITPTNFGDISSGGLSAGFTEEGYEAGWRAVDAIVRVLDGVPLQSDQPIGVLHEITASDLPSNIKVPYTVPRYQQAFEKAWGVG